MPIHNNTRAASRLREWMGAKGPAGIDTVSPEIVPVINVADLSGQDIAAREEVYKLGYHTQAATAGQYGHIQIFNPATSVTDIFLDSILFRAATSSLWTLRIYDTALTTQSGNLSTVDLPGKDSFVWGGGAADSVAQLRAQASASILGSIILMQGWAQSTASELIPLGIRILPGRGISINSMTVNHTILASFAWREVIDVP